MHSSLSLSGGRPLTSPQREIWFDQLFHGEAPLYNIGGYMRLGRAMDAVRFRESVAVLVRKYDVLRTVLHTRDDTGAADDALPDQVFADTLAFDVPFHDFSGADDPHTEAMAWMRQRFSEPFALHGEPLFRYALLKLDAESFYILGCYHHLIADGWTIALLVRALGDIYTALENGDDPDLAAPSYEAFIDNDRAYVNSPAFATQRDYWLKKFQPLPEPLFAARYRNQVSAQSAPSQCSTMTLQRDWYDRLGAFAREQGANTFHAILGALYVYFTRTARRGEIVIGLPVLNRGNAVFKETAGLFVGMTAARFGFGADMVFGGLLQAIGRELKQNYRHQRFPISELNRGLGRLHGAQGQLFDIGVSYERHDHAAVFGNVHGIAIPLVNEHQTAPLMLYVREFHDDEDVQVDFVYNKAFFNADEIAAIQQRLRNLLDEVQRTPDAPLNVLPVLSAAEYRMLTAGWNATAVDYPQARPVHQLIEMQAEATPDAQALVYEGSQLSYRELNAAANRLAHRLLFEGARPDMLIGICAERSVELVVGLLAILKAGAAYVPLDPDYPAERLAYMLGDTGAPLLLTQRAIWHRLGLQQDGLQVLALDMDLDSEFPSTNPGIEVDPRQLAYTIYTSGSTGKPKGAGVPHCGLTNRLLWMQETYTLTAADRVLQKTPFSFDVSVWEFFWPLMTGAVLVVARPGDHKEPARLAELIKRQGITTLHFVPAMLQAFVEHGALPDCTALRRVFASGEALPAELQQRFYRQSQAVLYNLYGPTEASIDVTAWTCVDEAAHTVPIGRPIANTQIYLLDAEMEPVPAGVEGELYIGGVQLARGYHRRPDLTAERFVPDPFGPPGSRLYRTGDVARWRMDGAIEYLGRTDHQVKIRGLRIELGEIEGVLLAHPDVREAVVMARNEEDSDGGGKRLVAYLVADAGVSEETLRAHLQASLPDYMLPSAFVLLEALPLSPNGKVDRKALPEPTFARGEYVAPNTATEIMVAQLWCDLLGCERAGLHDNFFALGGHSLLAARFVARLRTSCGAELPLRAIFEAPVLHALAQRVEAALVQAEGDSAGAAPLDAMPVAVERDAKLPLSFPQQRLWFLDRMESGSAFYNMAGGLRLAGVPDAKALEAALQDVVQRHEVLRTAYAMDADSDEVMQVIAAEARVPLRVTDLSALAAPERAAEARRLAEAEAAEPFDLRHAPPLRAHLLRLDVHEHWLLLTLHHIAADGWSMAVLQREISAFYNLHAAGIPAALPPLPLQYADFAAWQRRLPQGPQWQRQLGYWRDQLAGAPALLELPADHVRPARQSYRGDRLRFTVPAALAERLRVLGREHGATLFMTLLGAFGVLLSRYSAQDDICIGTPIAGRRHAEFEGLIGCFVNTLVLRLKRQGDPAFVQWLRSVRETALEAYTHQDIPFEQLVEALQPERALSHSPLFQVMFALHNTAPHAAALDGLKVQALDIDLPVAKFDLTLDMWEEAGALHACFEYSTDLFERATIERMAGHFQVLLEAVAQRPETPISQLPLLGDDERRRVLIEWNDSATVYPHAQTVQQLFEAQVRRSPQEVALAYEDSTLSYAELNAEANRLAHYLIGVGVGPDDLVGICLDRSIDMVVALLAVLKAGGAYVPLDPAYPRERLAMMLDDARPVLLLTRHTLLDGLQASSTPVFCFDAQRMALAVQPATDPRPALQPEHLAYVLYTSGSTGRPKGVMVRHGGLVNLAWHQAEKLRSHGCRSVLQFASINFDMSVEEIFPALITGARLVIRPSTMAAPDAAFLQLVASHDIDALNLPTVFWHEWVNRLQAGESMLPACVKLVAVGGEKVHAEQYRRWTQWTKMRDGSWCNAYGPTESTVNAAAFDVPFSETCRSREIPLGRPIANTQIHILDAQLNPVPTGVAGELHIAGAGLARGYLGRPDLTAEKFIPDPFSATPGARMYKSGDLARYLADGSIEYLGRMDGQVKIRGFRIELGEIEAALAAHSDVDEAVVTVHEDAAGGKRLVAYYMKAATATDAVDAAALRAHLAQGLPDYMLPAAYVQLAALPLTPNGKLDRRALPAPDEQALAARVYEAPQGETEQSMARIWTELLKLERVGRQDNFFELGGHSLLAVSLLERMRRHGLHADVRDLFTAPTLAGLAAAVGQRNAGAEIPPNRIPHDCIAIRPDMLPLVELAPADIERIVAAVPDGAANVQDIYPLGPLQQGILFHHLMTTEGDAYLERVLFATDTRERLDDFLSALQAVLKRHDILRTAVLWEGLPEPVQVVWRDATLPIEQFTPDSRMDDAANDIAAQLCARFDPRHYRLDVREAPLVRAVIAHDSAHDPENHRWLLLLLSHHLAFDHTALDILLEEVRAHMLMQAECLPAPLPFRNFIAQAKRGVSAAEHEAFFRRMLGDVDEPTVPFGLQDIRGDGSRIVESRREVAPELARRLRALARTLGVSAATLFHVAWAQVLARTSGRTDVVFGTVLFGRMQGGEGAERVMGLFINTLPLRLRMGEESIARNVRRAHALLAELLRHEHASLAQAQRCSAIPAPAPLFSALLNYRYSAQDAQSSRLRSWEGIELLSTEERSNYPFALSVDDLGEGFALTVQTDAAIDPARIGDFMHTALASLSDALETAPDTPSHAIDVLPPKERELLQSWNLTATGLPSGDTIHTLFEACAARHPGQVAVVFEDRSLTYAELNARANRLAHYLRAQGIGTDELVGICVERSLEMIVAVLGVLKAGAAYLPLDPALPQTRMAYMLGDAGPRLLLTQQHLLARLPATDIPSFCLDRDAAHLAAWPEHDPQQQAWPEHLAYVIYTSGSTGNPKGTLIHHRALVNLALAQQAALALRPGMRVLQWASFNFDASVWDIFPTLTAGAQLCLASHEAVLPGMNLLETLRRHRIELITLTPSSLSALPLEPLPELKTLVVAGERCDHALIAPWLKRYTVINAYGPTEATVCATVYPCTDDGRRHPPIGRPIANTQIHILDVYLQPAPIGVAGELYIAGEGLARGYLGRPDLTAERFTQNPFSDQPGARMYKTGDLARYLPDGHIEYIGRIDDQVKIRGYRIELGEIEFALNELPSVRQAAVLAQQAPAGGLRLVAYVVPAEAVSAESGAATLRTALARSLPDYMVPARFVFLPQIPVNTSGKVDRKALDALPLDEGEADGTNPEPVTLTEQRLAAIWAALLGRERFSRHDNFFHAGGHSLLAVQLAAKVKEEFDVALPLSQIFVSPTLAAFAQAVDARSMRAGLVVPMQGREPDRGQGVPTFLIHPSGGTIFCYDKLARQLGNSGPVYAIQSPEIAGLELDYDFDMLCRRYASEIATLYPDGAVRIAGWSLGGALALRITEILEQEQRTVESVSLFDTHIAIQKRVRTWEEFLAWAFLFLEPAALGLDRDFAAAHGQVRAFAETHGIENFLKLLRDDPQWLVEQGIDARYLDFLREQYRIQQAHVTLLAGFTPGVVDAPLHVVWAQDSVADGVLPVDWLSLTRTPARSTQCILPGHHDNLLLNAANLAVIAGNMLGRDDAE